MRPLLTTRAGRRRRARAAVVIKRSLAPGFAGIDNPLFYKEGTAMLFADAKQALHDLSAALVTV